MFSGLGRPTPPYMIVSRKSTTQVIERVAFSPVHATKSHAQKPVPLGGAREGEGKGEFMENINRKRMK
jgi:hypothetical protein